MWDNVFVIRFRAVHVTRRFNPALTIMPWLIFASDALVHNGRHGIPVMRQWARIARIAWIAARGFAGGVYGASYYYTSEPRQGCASCHEMQRIVTAVHGSHHRTGTCMEWHEASLGTKLRHITVPLTRSWPRRSAAAGMWNMTPKSSSATSTSTPVGIRVRH